MSVMLLLCFISTTTAYSAQQLFDQYLEIHELIESSTYSDVAKYARKFGWVTIVNTSYGLQTQILPSQNVLDSTPGNLAYETTYLVNTTGITYGGISKRAGTLFEFGVSTIGSSKDISTIAVNAPILVEQLMGAWKGANNDIESMNGCYIRKINSHGVLMPTESCVTKLVAAEDKALFGSTGKFKCPVQGVCAVIRNEPTTDWVTFAIGADYDVVAGLSCRTYVVETKAEQAC